MTDCILAETPAKQKQDTQPGQDRFLIRRNGEQWREVDLYCFSHGENGYLKLGETHIYARRGEMVRKLRAAAHHLENGAHFEGKPYKLPENAYDVVEYFRASPDLSYMADELENAFGLMSDPQALLKSDLAKARKHLKAGDLVQAGKAVRGAQSRIADVLGIPNAGSYRKRILAVLEVLRRENNSTTTTETPVIVQNSVVESLAG